MQCSPGCLAPLSFSPFGILPSGNWDKNASSTENGLQSIPLFKVSSARGIKLFELFISRGLFDNALNFLPGNAFLQRRLPALEKSQVDRLVSLFFKPIEVKGRYYSDQNQLNLANLMAQLFGQNPQIESLEIAGSQVYRLLGKRWFERYFEALGFPEFSLHLSEALFQRKSRDIDLHLNIPGASNASLKKIACHAAAFILNMPTPCMVDPRFFKELFSKFDPFDNGINRGFGLGFGGPDGCDFDLSLIAQLYRSYIFDHDSLVIKFDRQALTDLIQLKGSQVKSNRSAISVEGKISGGWSAPLFWMSKVVHTSAPGGIDLSGCAVLLSHYTKGAICLCRDLEENLMSKIISVLKDLRNKNVAISKLCKALHNHLPTRGESAVAFCFNVLRLLERQGKIDLIEQNLVDRLLENRPEIKSPLLSIVADLLSENCAHFPLISAYLTVYAHLLSANHSQAVLETGPKGYSALQMRLSQDSDAWHLILPAELLEALNVLLQNPEKLVAFVELEACCMEGLELLLTKQPNIQAEGREEELQELSALALKCLDVPGLQALGFNLLCLLQTCFKDQASRLLVKNLVRLMPLVECSRKKQSMLHYFLHYCQHGLGIHLKPEIADKVELFVKDLPASNKGQAIKLVEFLISLSHPLILSPLYSIWKGNHSAALQAAHANAGKMLLETLLEDLPDCAAQVLTELTKHPVHSPEDLWTSFIAICRRLAKKQLKLEDSSLILSLKTVSMQLMRKMARKKIELTSGSKWQFWLVQQLSHYFPLDALQLAQAFENQTSFEESCEYRKAAWTRLCRMAFSEGHPFFEWPKRLEILTYALKINPSDSDKGFYKQQIRALLESAEQGEELAQRQGWLCLFNRMLREEFCLEIYPEDSERVELMLEWARKSFVDTPKYDLEGLGEAIKLLSAVDECNLPANHREIYLKTFSALLRLHSKTLEYFAENLQAVLEKFGPAKVFELIDRMAFSRVEELGLPANLLPLLDFFLEQTDGLPPAVEVAKWIFKNFPPNPKTEGYRRCAAIKQRASILNSRLVLETSHFSASLEILNEVSTHPVFTVKERSDQWGNFFLCHFQKAELTGSHADILTALNLFVSSINKIAHSPQVEERCLQAVGKLLPKLFLLKLERLDYDRLLESLFNKYGSLEFFRMHDGVTQKHPPKAKVPAKSTRNSCLPVSLKGPASEKFFKLLEAIATQLTIETYKSVSAHQFVTEQFCIFIGILSFLYRDKAENIYKMLYAYTFRVIPAQEEIFCSHVTGVSNLYQNTLKALLKPIDNQKAFEIELFNRTICQPHSKMSLDNQRKGVVEVIQKLARSDHGMMHQRVILILRNLPSHLFKEHLNLLQTCYDALFDRLLQASVGSEEDLLTPGELIANLMKLAKEYKDPYPLDYASLLAHLFERYFDYIIYLSSQDEASDPLEFCQVLHSTILAVVDLPLIYSRPEVVEILLKKLFQLAKTALSKQKTVELLPLFRFLRAKYQQSPAGTKMLSKAVGEWFEILQTAASPQSSLIVEHLRKSGF